MSAEASDRRGTCCGTSRPVAAELWPVNLYPDTHISSLGLDGDSEVRRLLRPALRDSWPAAKHFGWKVGSLCEMEPQEKEVGYSAEDGTLFVKVRDPMRIFGRFYMYGFILATLLHELTHFSVLGHGKAFYRRLVEAVNSCGADFSVRREVRQHVCGELLNAVCENDARRARALLAVLPEAASCRSGIGNQLPLEYAAHNGRVNLTKILLKAKADPDTSCQRGVVPPLARAAARGNSKTAMVLLEAGALRGRDVLQLADTPLAIAVSRTDPTSDRLQPKRRLWDENLKIRRAESLPALSSTTTSTSDGVRLQAGSGGYLQRAVPVAGSKAPCRVVTLSGSLAL